MIEALLVAICLLDASFCGFRDAAGRNKLIRKWGYYRRSIAVGTLLGIAGALAIAATVAICVSTAADPGSMYQRYLDAGGIMLRLYLPFTSLVLVALMIFAIPVPHIRALATVTILGPFTLLRPIVIAAGALWAMVAARDPAIIVSLLVTIALIAPGGRWLSWLRINHLSLEEMIALEKHTAQRS
jgi:hypothetical protein